MFDKRQKFIIYPKFQWMLILGQLVCLLLILAGVCISVSTSIEDLSWIASESGFDVNHPMTMAIADQKRILLIKVAFACATGLVLSLIWMLYISQRVVGPIIRLRSYFSSFNKTDSPPVKFRENDFFSDLPPLINKVLEKDQP